MQEAVAFLAELLVAWGERAALLAVVLLLGAGVRAIRTSLALVGGL